MTKRQDNDEIRSILIKLAQKIVQNQIVFASDYTKPTKMQLLWLTFNLNENKIDLYLHKD